MIFGTQGFPAKHVAETFPRFPIPVKVGLKEAKAAFASFALSFVQIEKRETVFHLMFRRGPTIQTCSTGTVHVGRKNEKIIKTSNQKSEKKKSIGWTCKKCIFSFFGKPSVRDRLLYTGNVVK